jgi:single-strand DNA-binding protein
LFGGSSSVFAPLRHRFGAFHAPGGSSLFCFGPAALQVTVSLEILFAERQRKDFSEPSVNAELRHLGAWPARHLVPRSRAEQIHKPRTIMYHNKVTLIGFLGGDAELRSSDGRNFTILSLATKTSYRKVEAYVSRTEWHRCVVFGPLSEFAATLKKGSHIQLEGELCSRNYVSPTNSRQRRWETRVASILKLDPAEKAASEAGQAEEVAQSEASA